jgi:hypothetical protein
MVKISVAQALLILIDKYQQQLAKQQPVMSLVSLVDEKTPVAPQPDLKASLESKITRLKRLYLSGSEGRKDTSIFKLIDEGMKNGIFKDYIISSVDKDINEDPTRRYFETHLAYETLLHTLKDLSLDQLNVYYQSFLNWAVDGIEQTYSLRHEYGNAIMKTRVASYYTHFSSEEREKLELLLRCSHLGILLLKKHSYGVPLDIYGLGFFSGSGRGRTENSDYDKIASQHMGLMKTYMPVPRNDLATVASSLALMRVADFFSFISEAAWPQENFSKLTHPFSASISGTMLAQLRSLCYLQDLVLENNNSEKLGKYLVCMASVLLYNSGGHSFNEFFAVLALPRILEGFNFFDGFKTLTMDNLLFINNQKAFQIALERTIQYNNTLINKYKAHAIICYFDQKKLLSPVKKPVNKDDFKAVDLRTQKDNLVKELTNRINHQVTSLEKKKKMSLFSLGTDQSKIDLEMKLLEHLKKPNKVRLDEKDVEHLSRGDAQLKSMLQSYKDLGVTYYHIHKSVPEKKPTA